MEALRQGTGHCVVGFDFYGHGFSECPKEIGYDNNDLAEQVLELLDALGIQRPVVLVGHSMGGLVAMTFAAHHPKRVAKLVLLNSIGLPPPASLHLPTLICVAFRGVYAGMRLPGVRHVAARLGSMAMASLADAGDVTHEQVLQVFRQQQRTDFGPGGQLVRGASMLMLMWAWQQRLSTRDVVFSAFLRRWNPFGDFEHTVRQTAAHQHPILILWGDKVQSNDGNKSRHNKNKHRAFF
jgi:pimeloyl-ACP methyl ester carboxylesterase